jgi:hypothetical protein
VEIGDRCSSALDESYQRYVTFVVKTYGIEPAPMSLWSRVYYRGITNHAQVRLVSGAEHKRRKAERAQAAAQALTALTGA